MSTPPDVTPFRPAATASTTASTAAATNAPFGATPSPPPVIRTAAPSPAFHEGGGSNDYRADQTVAALEAAAATASSALKSPMSKPAGHPSRMENFSFANNSIRNISFSALPEQWGSVMTMKQKMEQQENGVAGNAAATSAGGRPAGHHRTVSEAISIATTARSRRSNKLPDDVKSVETQTVLSYSGDYLHGRPVLVKMETQDNFFSSLTAVAFGGTMIISLLMGSVSYFLSWRVRDPALLKLRNLEFYASMYPFVLALGMLMTYGVSLPCLGMVASGFIEMKRQDFFFLIAIVVHSVFFGIPAMIIEADWLLPLDKDEVVYYRWDDLTVSRVALAMYFIVTGGALWFIYLTYLSRKLNDAVEDRAKLWHEYRRGLRGNHVCFAARVAVKSADEIEVREGDPEDPWHEKLSKMDLVYANGEDGNETEMRRVDAATTRDAAAQNNDDDQRVAQQQHRDADDDDDADDDGAEGCSQVANPVGRRKGGVPWGRSDPRSPIED